MRTALTRGASPLGLPYTLSGAPLRRRAPFAWLARAFAGAQLVYEMASTLGRLVPRSIVVAVDSHIGVLVDLSGPQPFSPI